MALKRTIHGEKLQERTPFSGVHAKKRFKVRDVFCPRCRAKPHRKCHWKGEEFQGDYCVWTRKVWGRTREQAEREARRRNRTGGHNHEERRVRAEQLTDLARQGRTTTCATALPLSVVGGDRAALGADEAASRERKTAPLYRLAVKDAVEERRLVQRFDHLPLFQAAASDDAGRQSPRPDDDLEATVGSPGTARGQTSQ
jgi:hypothetical protein